METWLTPESDKIFSIPGFYCFDIYRNQYGGGIKMYLKECIQCKILQNFTVITGLLELLTVELFLWWFKAYFNDRVSSFYCLSTKKKKYIYMSLCTYLHPICVTY